MPCEARYQIEMSVVPRQKEHTIHLVSRIHLRDGGHRLIKSQMGMARFTEALRLAHFVSWKGRAVEVHFPIFGFKSYLPI